MKIREQAFSLIYSILVAVLFFSVGNVVFAADSRLVLYEEVTVIEVDDETGEEYETWDYITTHIEDGGMYPVDLSYTYQLGLDSNAVVDRTPPQQHMIGFFGKLYFIDEDTGERVYKTDIAGPSGSWELVWEDAGEYELDIYAWDEPIPILSQIPWWQFLFDKFVAVAYAQAPEQFVETIHFTITEEGAAAQCCSNVLFLPGIKGSVLKANGDSLWPPTFIQTFNGGIAALALNENGESANPVVVDGVLETFYGVPVYAPFISFMDGLVDEEVINDWRPLPYDWRFSAERILEDGIETEDGVLDVITEIEALAADSDTGQISIVAHSMGGLLGKAIIKKLEEDGKEDLIDSFVMVGSPQLGTPQAIAGILHGGGESMGFGFIVNPVTSRTVAQTMQTTHDLLPSPEYFNTVTDPVITFDPNAEFTAPWRALWGDSINTYGEFEAFLTGQADGRYNPPIDNLHAPEILRSDLVNTAEDFHQEYDEYVFPPNIRVVQIAGWGVPTVKALRYQNEHLYPSYRIIKTREGDGVVVYPSTVQTQVGETYFFNIFEYNENTDVSFGHKDLLSASSIQDLVRSFVKEEVLNDVTFITETKPSSEEVEMQLLISTYSPVILGVYDDEGNFTGINPHQDLSSDFLFITEDIPGSSFVSFGESQQIYLPKDGTYTFTYKGIGNGSTTVEIATFADDVETVVATYTDMPTTDSTIATFETNSTDLEDTEILLDLNGDGITDEEILQDGSVPQELSLEELIVLFKTQIADITASKSIKKSLLSLTNAFEKTLKIKSNILRALSGRATLKVIEAEIQFLKKKKRVPIHDIERLVEILNKIKPKI